MSDTTPLSGGEKALVAISLVAAVLGGVFLAAALRGDADQWWSFGGAVLIIVMNGFSLRHRRQERRGQGGGRADTPGDDP